MFLTHFTRKSHQCFMTQRFFVPMSTWRFCAVIKLVMLKLYYALSPPTPNKASFTSWDPKRPSPLSTSDQALDLRHAQTGSSSTIWGRPASHSLENNWCVQYRSRSYLYFALKSARCESATLNVRHHVTILNAFLPSDSTVILELLEVPLAAIIPWVFCMKLISPPLSLANPTFFASPQLSRKGAEPLDIK